MMVDRDSGMSAPEALGGKKLGVSFGSDSHLDTLVWLKEVGLSDKVSLINIAPAELVIALANKSVDAIVIRQPQVLRLQQQSGAQILHTWPFRFVSIVKTKFMIQHPNEVEKYLAGLRQAILFIAQNHQKSADWFGAYLRTDPAIIQTVSTDDPFYTATDLGQVDILVKPANRPVLGHWPPDSRGRTMIKRPLDLESLFQ